MGLGRVVKGHVLDIDRKYLERLMQNYDPLLYLEWNPDKNKGNGCWEVWRRPEVRTPVFKGFGPNGEHVYVMEYAIDKMVHHVMDVPNLDMRVMDRLFEMDTFRVDGNWVEAMEYQAKKREEKLEAQRTEEIRYMIRENKKYYSQLKEYVQQGYNPAWFYSNHRKS